jgi:thiosulfate/3-mercaptopyruvate sulfurtransferase
MYRTLITPEQLQDLQAQGQQVMVFDCSFDLMQPSAGAQQFEQAHIPGAVYANLNTDLSAHKEGAGSHGSSTAGGADRPSSGGRHPLPHRERFALWLSSVGLSNTMQAVAYDRQGCNYCGRLWWMLKWAGHEAVAVLDGGLQGWQAAGGQLAHGSAAVHVQSSFKLGPSLARSVSVEEVEQGLQGAQQTVVDARVPARFRGEVEPLDPVAGRIPGALNRPFAQNLGPDGRFKPAEQLRLEFEQLLGTRDPAGVVHQCGSGVSALPNLLAMEIAGLGGSGLFAGSWSEWCSDPKRPIAKG